MKKIDINTNALVFPDGTVGSWIKTNSAEVAPKMRSTVKIYLPSIEFLIVYPGHGRETHLTGEISAFVLGCRESLQESHSSVVLLTGVVRLMNFLNFRAESTEQGSPQVTDLINHEILGSTTPLFPSLETLNLRSNANPVVLHIQSREGLQPSIDRGEGLPSQPLMHLPLSLPLLS